MRSAAYPKLVWQGKRSPPQCSVCASAGADWEVHGDTYADSTPCLLCEQCHFQFHYDAEGRLRSRHKQFRIVAEGAFPHPCDLDGGRDALESVEAREEHASDGDPPELPLLASDGDPPELPLLALTNSSG